MLQLTTIEEIIEEIKNYADTLDVPWAYLMASFKVTAPVAVSRFSGCQECWEFSQQDFCQVYNSGSSTSPSNFVCQAWLTECWQGEFMMEIRCVDKKITWGCFKGVTKVCFLMLFWWSVLRHLHQRKVYRIFTLPEAEDLSQLQAWDGLETLKPWDGFQLCKISVKFYIQIFEIEFTRIYDLCITIRCTTNVCSNGAC